MSIKTLWSFAKEAFLFRLLNLGGCRGRNSCGEMGELWNPWFWWWSRFGGRKRRGSSSMREVIYFRIGSSVWGDERGREARGGRSRTSGVSLWHAVLIRCTWEAGRRSEDNVETDTHTQHLCITNVTLEQKLKIVDQTLAHAESE